MLPITLAAGAAFVVLLLVFAVASVRARRLLKAPEDFFHFKGERRNFIKLLVATTSVGAGLSYALAAGGRNGLLMLAGRNVSTILRHPGFEFRLPSWRFSVVG